MPDALSARHMRQALRLARKGWGQTAPNPMVGALVVRDGIIVGRGYHAAFGGDHAEIVALREAGERARGATLIVTLEPCNHTGKTPPCSQAVVQAGITSVVMGSSDPNPAAAGGAEFLRASGVQVILVDGAAAAECIEVNAPFFWQFRSDRPWTTLKLALSLDGAVTDSVRSTAFLTGTQSRREVHRMRAGSDAIAVGLRTALSDNPRLTVRGRVQPRKPVVRVVISRSGSLPPDSWLVTTAGSVPTWHVLTGSGGAQTLLPEGSGGTLPDGFSSAGPEAGANQVIRLRANGLPDALKVLADRGVRSVLVEGGGGLTSALLNEGLVDRLTIFRAPVILGAASLNAFGSVTAKRISEAVRLPVVQEKRLGDDTMTTYALTEI